MGRRPCSLLASQTQLPAAVSNTQPASCLKVRNEWQKTAWQWCTGEMGQLKEYLRSGTCTDSIINKKFDNMMHRKHVLYALANLIPTADTRVILVYAI